MIKDLDAFRQRGTWLRPKAELLRDLDALAADPATRAALTQHASTFLDQVSMTRLHQDRVRTVLGLLRADMKATQGDSP